MSVPTSKSKEKQGLHFSSLFLQLVCECHCLDLTVPDVGICVYVDMLQLLKRMYFSCFALAMSQMDTPHTNQQLQRCGVYAVIHIERDYGTMLAYNTENSGAISNKLHTYPSTMLFLPLHNASLPPSPFPSFLPILTLLQKMLPNKYTVTTPTRLYPTVTAHQLMYPYQKGWYQPA